MVPTNHTSNKPAPHPHNPLVCGLGYASDCDECRAAKDREDREFLERDAEAKERTRRREIGRRLAEATGFSLPELANALLPELAEGMAEIAGAVLDERGTA